MEFSWTNIKNKLKTRDWKWLTKIICLVTIIALVVTKQMVKLAVQTNLKQGQEYSFLPGFINFKYIINYGSAFSFFQNQRIFLTTFAFLISITGIIWLLFAKSITRTLGLSFIIAGTLGNLIDRFLHNGGVVDFLSWQLFPPYTIFNTADTFITIGIIIIILQLIIEPIIHHYQEKNGEQSNDITNYGFTTSIEKRHASDKNNISWNIKYQTRQVSNFCFRTIPLFTKFYSNLNC
ncbi:signal peptidase II [Spiroplasma endosymbiont of Nebria brevicollis]|uniref:signal peptidase II n=1 Tax=Spiroplasma endosymbiont of Nebria brevicollis TaxID=3066284 RepID=UPI00313C109A